jgi:hypothetical protein
LTHTKIVFFEENRDFFDIEKTAFAISDLTRGIATQRLLGMSKTRLEDDVEFIVNVIWKGIAR